MIKYENIRMFRVDENRYLCEVGFNKDLIKAKEVEINGEEYILNREPVWDDFVGTKMSLNLSKKVNLEKG